MTAVNRKLRQIVAVLSAVLFTVSNNAVFAAPVQAPTPSGSAHTAPVNLDLTSTAATVQGGTAVSQPVTIRVGNTNQSVSSASALTPAERVAMYQVLGAGRQSIDIGALGN